MAGYQNYLGRTTVAHELLKTLEKNGFEIKAPINIEVIYKQYLSIDYKIVPNFNKIKITGSISIENGKPFVWINPMKNAQEERKRFTLAHELGHFMLHIAPLENLNNIKAIEDINISFNRDDNWSLQEMEANNFAAQLLMPIELLNKELKSNFQEKPQLEKAVLQLAPIFNVSSSAMEYRLKKLGLNNE